MNFIFFHFVFLAIHIYIAIVVATHKKVATKATTSLPTLLYQWMDESSLYLIHEGVQPPSHLVHRQKSVIACQLKYCTCTCCKALRACKKVYILDKITKFKWKNNFKLYIYSVYLTRMCKF